MGVLFFFLQYQRVLNPLNAELNPICHMLALLGAHHILHVSGLRVKRQPFLLRFPFLNNQNRS